jgi:hypothetical protein
MNAQHDANIPSYKEEDAMAPGTVLRLVNGVTRMTEADGDVSYWYRGREIEFNPSVSNGYYGRWTTRKGGGFETMAQAKAYIDKKIEEKRAQAANV